MCFKWKNITVTASQVSYVMQLIAPTTTQKNVLHLTLQSATAMPHHQEKQSAIHLKQNNRANRGVDQQPLTY